MAVGKGKGKVWEKMMNERIVYLGEAEQVPTRDDKDLEVEILKNFSKRYGEANRSITLALKAFPTDLQFHLDQFVAKRELVGIMKIALKLGTWGVEYGKEELQESIDSGFTRFNTIITSLKALDEESKDLTSLALDELIGNLKVHEVVMEKDFEIYKGEKERVKYIALKAKKESSDDETSTSGSDDEEYAMAVRNFKKFFRREGKFVRQPREEKKSFQQRDEKKGKSDQKCFRCGDPNHLIGDCPKPPR
nr:protein zinc/cadmium/lead-transporting P-type ATPase [Tanacetum cinerariifolium]